jgi:hypothetical protein
MGLTVAQIFKDSRLSVLAENSSSDNNYGSYTTKPFELMPDDSVLDVIRRDCNLPADAQFDDVYPATSVQEAFMAGSKKLPGTLLATRLWRLGSHVDIPTFKAAWEQLFQYFPNMRTRYVMHTTGETIGAVLQEDLAWEDTTGFSVHSYMDYAACNMKMCYGTKLSRNAIIKEDGEYFFAWFQHHAILDGWTMGLVIDNLFSAYHGMELRPLKNIASFVKYCKSLDEEAMAEYWRKELSGCQRTTFPPERTPTTRLRHVTKHHPNIIRLPGIFKNYDITSSTIMTVACAAMLSHFSKQDDVTTMTISSGRHAPVEGLEKIPGCITARMPLRVRFDHNQTVKELLEKIQDDASDRVAFEQYGVQNMAKLSPEIANAITDTTSVFSMQPWHQKSAVKEGLEIDEDDLQPLLQTAHDKYSLAETSDGFFTQSLVVQCWTAEEDIDIETYWNSDVLTDLQAVAASDYIGKVACAFVENMDKPVLEVLRKMT